MLNELAKEITQIANEHGWFDKDREFGTTIALMHSELSEALEHHRNGRPVNLIFEHYTSQDGSLPKPDGVGIELIDCVVRILHCLYEHGCDADELMKRKMEYNKTRPYRHGGKKC